MNPTVVLDLLVSIPDLLEFWGCAYRRGLTVNQKLSPNAEESSEEKLCRETQAGSSRTLLEASN